VSLYRKLGFRETRKLAVFSLNKKFIKSPDKIANSVQIRKIEDPNWRLFESFWIGLPSWQNSVCSIKRSRNEKVFLGAFSGEQCVGYAAAFPASGSVLQLAVGKDFRRKGIGTYLLAALQNEASTPEMQMRITNIDYSLKETLAFCEALGFKHDLDQYEMTRDL
jgi:GNAT superfamily N-acetyltransferase